MSYQSKESEKSQSKIDGVPKFKRRGLDSSEIYIAQMIVQIQSDISWEYNCARADFFSLACPVSRVKGLGPARSALRDKL